MVHYLSFATVLLPAFAAAQSCSLKPSGSIQPSVASGYQMQVVATGLSKPRGIIFDNAGNLLVVEQGRGRVSAHSLADQNGCVVVTNSRDATDNLTLNHGIEISPDGKTLYASTPEAAYSFDYDSGARSTSNQKTLVANMTTDDHTTRTLLLTRKAPGMLVISRGSTSNIDIEAASLDSGHSQVKAFNLTAMNGAAYDFNKDGELLGWGLRNEVGIAEHPLSGGIYGVENSVDQLHRAGVDVHEDNPGEELNFLGYLNGTKGPHQGQNFGYPWCFAAWSTQSLPNNGNLSIGSQFAVDATPDSDNQNKTDEYCAAQAPPSLVFQAHMAPLDMKFNNSGADGWIPFHGSWDRDEPSGYKLSVVSFTDDGSPVDPSTSTTAAKDIFANQDNSKCPDNCFRPVALAFDKQGRAFMSSDATGEIYMISRVANGSSSGTGSGAAGSSSNKTSGGDITLPALGLLAVCILVPLAMLLL